MLTAPERIEQSTRRIPEMAVSSAVSLNWQVTSVAFSSSGTWVVCGAHDEKVTLMDASSGNVRWQKEMGGEVCGSCDRSTSSDCPRPSLLR